MADMPLPDNTVTEEVASPCNKICVLDDQNGWCRGCGRTLEEIAHWTEYSTTEKQEVLQLAAQRRAAVINR